MADKNVNSYWISMNRFVTFLTVLDIFNDEPVIFNDGPTNN